MLREETGGWREVRKGRGWEMWGGSCTMGLGRILVSVCR